GSLGTLSATLEYTTHCGANSRSRRYTLWRRGRADHPENPAAFCHRRSHHPVEHLRVALLHTPHTELVKRRSARICHEDFRHARGDTMTHQLIQGVYKFLPKANVSPHDELEGRKIRRGEVRKAALAGHDVHPIALGVQMEIGKHRRVSVEPCHLGLKRFGAG